MENTAKYVTTLFRMKRSNNVAMALIFVLAQKEIIILNVIQKDT